MSETRIKEICSLPFHKDTEQAIKTLLCILSNDWIKGLTALKRSKVLVNKFGSNKEGEQITKIINSVEKAVPEKYNRRYLKYFSSIIPLNTLLQELSNGIIKSEFWLLDKEVCLASLLARFECVYAHIDFNARSSLDAKGDNTIFVGKPVFLRGDDGSFIEVDRKFQQLAASLDRNLRFIEYYLKRVPIVNLDIPPETYKAGTFQMAGELWNSIFYLIDRVSFFGWYSTKEDENPETLYYQPKNKTEHILEIVGGLRESQWLLQQLIDSGNVYGSIREPIKSDDPLVPRSDEEFRAYVELSEICHDNRILDVEFKNKLKVKEYIRAWFVISEIAREHFNEKKQSLLETKDKLDVSNLLIISANALIELLTEKGKLDCVSAQKSIDLLTYWNMDHDIFSSPLFPTTKGEYLILTSIFISGNPVRSAFRLLSHDGIDISFKGISSEKELKKIFTKMGFNCLTGHKFYDELGEGDIDCIAFKENTFIICESKNIIPNESIYDRYRTLTLFAQKASNQANRATRFVSSHLSEICEQLSITISNTEEVRIYPFIITNLFDFSGLVINGVHICDFSALGKFATAKYVYRIIRDKEDMSRIPSKELYKGDVPTAAEVLNQLYKPFQIEYQAKKLRESPITQPMTRNLTLKIFDVRESEITDKEFESI